MHRRIKADPARRKKSKDEPTTTATTQTAVRLPTEWMGRLIAIAEAMSVPGLDLTSSDALRMALAIGMGELEVKHGLAAPEKRRKAANA